jgi:hypothetical protein
MANIVSVSDALGHLEERMNAALRRAQRTDEVTLVAVTKLVDPGRIAEAYRCGIRHFGENRVQEAAEKRRFLSLPEATWHLVGHLQSNKARQAVELFDWIQSLDSVALAERLNRLAAAGKKVPVLIQVNLGNEASKQGISEEGLLPLVERTAALPHLELRGLMCLPPYFDDPEQVRPFFRRLAELRDALAPRVPSGVNLGELSMGMSHDFEVAIEEGATMIRVGTALFGPRPSQ